MSDPPGATDAFAKEVLSAVLEALGHLTDSRHTRDLRAKARRYEMVLRHWTAVPPSQAQRSAMLDLVTDLYTEAVNAKKRRVSVAPPSRTSNDLRETVRPPR